jgi:hypothetical protein
VSTGRGCGFVLKRSKMLEFGDELGERSEQLHRAHRAADAGRILKRTAAVQAPRGLTDDRQNRRRRLVRFGEAGDQVHHAAAGGARAHGERAVNAGVAVGHERRAVLALGQDRAQIVTAQAVDRVVEVLDVRAAHPEDVANAEPFQGLDECVG